MATPASFEESNAVLEKPGDTGVDDCTSALSVCIAQHHGVPVVISCWKLSAKELEEINRTGRVWLGICGDTMPSAWVAGIKPF
jgi:hypothetical protein